MKAYAIFLNLFLLIFSAQAHPYSIFHENGKAGVKSQDGKVLIPAMYEAIGWTDGSFTFVNAVTGYQKDGQCGLINLNNNHIIKNEFSTLTPTATFIIAGKKLKGSPTATVGVITASGKTL